MKKILLTLLLCLNFAALKADPIDDLANLFYSSKKSSIISAWEHNQTIDLSGELPAGFWDKFESLKAKVRTLKLKKCSLTEMPNLDGCVALEWLDLSHNALEGTVDFSGLKALEQLSVHGNKFTSITGLSQLSELKCVDFSSNKLTECPDFGRHEKLTVLMLGNNFLTECPTFYGCPALSSLFLGHNCIEALRDFRLYENLTFLDLQANPLKEEPMVGSKCRALFPFVPKIFEG